MSLDGSSGGSGYGFGFGFSGLGFVLGLLEDFARFN